MKNQKGFTLIELLAVMGILAVVGGITSAIVISTLRAADKTNQINIVRQNGNVALEQISRSVQYAKSFNGVSMDEENFNTDCTPGPSPSPSPDTIHYSSVQVTLSDESVVTYSCDPPGDPTSLTSSTSAATIPLVDTNVIKVSQCYFTCVQGYKTAAPTIGINLVLEENKGSDQNQVETSISFDTSVTMRNPNK